MKLFNNQPDVSEYFRHAILDEENELEAIFCYENTAKNPLNKKYLLNFLKNLEKFMNHFPKENLLDIRTEFRNNVSNVRCTIKGLESIKQYCREDDLESIPESKY